MEALKYLPGIAAIAVATAWVPFIDWYVNPIMARRRARRETELQESFSGLEERTYEIARDSAMQGYNASGLVVKALHEKE